MHLGMVAGDFNDPELNAVSKEKKVYGVGDRRCKVTLITYRAKPL